MLLTMRKNHFTGMAVAVLLATASVSSIRAEDDGRISFNRQIKPILSDRCFKCHGPDAKNQKSKFRLDTREHALEDLDGVTGIAPGDLKQSDVHFRIHKDAGDDLMPPAKSNLKLSDEEIALIDQWILEGAQYDKHWSFKPIPTSVDVPPSESGWAINEIDLFTERKMLKGGFTPAAATPKEKWLRRVHFDLTGLPPTPGDIDAFLADTSPQACEKVVDRLFTSTAYAERMTSEWLDVARYSDSYGYQRDAERLAWPWRDWVIGAFADNMPYDEFFTLQLAGDLLPDASHETILPTAFNRLHSQKMEGGIVLEEFRVEYVADRTQTVSAALMGLTMECCRCHDHKYDPLPTKDYYELSAFFANVDESGLISYFTDAVPTPAMPIVTTQAEAVFAQSEKDIATLEQQLRTLHTNADKSEAFQHWLTRRPELHWPGLIADVSFDELSDEEFINAAAVDHPVTTEEGNRLVEGVAGKSVQFTGDDILEVQGVGHFPREHPFSISLWIRPDRITDRENILSRSGGADDAASMGYELLLLDGKLTFSLTHFWPGNSMRVQTTSPVAAQQWSQVAVSYDGSSRAAGVRIFVNGVEQDLDVVRDGLTREIDNYRGDHNSDRKHIVLGQRYRDRGFKNGRIDELRIFDRELCRAEARQLYDGKHLSTLLAIDAAALSANQRSDLLEYFLITSSTSAQQLRSDLLAARTLWNDTMDALPDIAVMREMPEPRPTFVLERGVYDSHGERVFPDTPGVLPPFPADAPRNRLGLAQWLATPDHPLTARVAVNRYWQMMFGEGLVRTPEDFGNQGDAPTHPELLDWLARDFIDSGWNVQHLLKSLVLSATYRQSTLTDEDTRRKDPQNLYLSHSHPTRLPAEMVRDNALAISGLLDPTVGGEPVQPYDLFSTLKPTERDAAAQSYRRSLYTLWKRNAPSPAMVVFDASTRDVCTLQREATTSPLQPLVLLNGPQFVEAARVLSGELLRKHGGKIDAVIEEAFVLLTSRRPDAEETKILSRLHQLQLNKFSANPEAASQHLEIGDAPLQLAGTPAGHAAAAVVVNAMMNLNESLIER